MKNKLINKNIISAISIALSATMAMGPVVSLAEATEDTNTPLDEPTVTDSQDAPEEASEVNELENAASDLEDSISDAQDAVDALEEAVFNEENPATVEDGGAIASDEVAAFVEAAENVVNDDSLDKAQDLVEEAAGALELAGDADAEVTDELSDAFNAANAAQDFADAAVNTVDNANEEAEELLTTVENTKDQDVAKEAVAKIDKLVEETEKDIEIAKVAVEELSEKYDDAVVKLRAAEQKYNDSIGKAGADIAQAKIELEKAEENVATLETALNEAKEELAEENKAANIIKSAENSLKADWTTQGKFLETFLINYYIPQLIDPDAEGITISKNKGFNGQESTRYIATYTDNKHESHTKYFNYDRINRTYSDEDMWANLGNSKDIVIYEKTEEEVEADKYLDNYCKKNHINLGDKNASSKIEGSFKNRVNSGEFDVFAYDDNGHTGFMVRDEINKGIENHTVTEENGVYYINGNPAHKVDYTTAKTASIKIDVANDEELNTFLHDAQEYVNKYEKFSVAAQEVEEAITKAKNEAESLNNAIDTLQHDHSARTAKEALGVDDVATYLEIEVTEDIAARLNEMSIDDAITYLDQLLQDAKDKVNSAELKLRDLKTKLSDAEAHLNELVSKITPVDVMELLEDVEYPNMPAYDYSADADSANDSTDDTSDDTTNDTAEAPAAPAAPIAPTGGTSTAALDGTASAPAAAVADDGNVLGLNRGEGTITADTANNSVPNKIEASVDLQESNGQIDQNLVTIDGGKTALSGNIVTDAADAQGMSWWWIVVIALLGKAGRDMYRKHMEKKGIFVEVKKED